LNYSLANAYGFAPKAPEALCYSYKGWVNLKEILLKYIIGIKNTNSEVAEKAMLKMDSLIKPPKSLGKLEEIAVKISSITGRVENELNKKCVIIMCSDNGVVEEGIASAPQEITHSMAVNFTKGITGVAVLAKNCGADIKIYDVGVNAEIKTPMVINKKIRKSTSNIKLGAAMSYEEAIKAILIGIEAVGAAARDGYQLIGVGEMGIGNTTTTTAILYALTDISPEKITGKGAGLNEKSYKNKIDVIHTAVKINKPNVKDPVDLIAKLGGFDIAAMTGAFIGAAYYRLPVVVDGYISIASAYLAYLMCDKVKEYMFLSHMSEEPGYKEYMQLLGLEPALNLNMKLGEGSGCPIMFDIIKAACAVMNNMATFEEALVGTGEEYLSNLE